jgi:hypothetical protein
MKTREQNFEELCWGKVAESDISRTYTINGREMQGTETVTPIGVYFAAEEGALYFAPWMKSYIQQIPTFREITWTMGLSRKQAIILNYLSRV